MPKIVLNLGHGADKREVLASVPVLHVTVECPQSRGIADFVVKGAANVFVGEVCRCITCVIHDF